MVDAVTAIGLVGMAAVGLMIVGMLYLTVLAVQSDRDEPNTEPAGKNG